MITAPAGPLRRLAWIAAGTVALAGTLWLLAVPRTPPAAAPARTVGDTRVPVVIAPARAASDVLTVDAVGSGRARRSATLQPAVAGEVASLHFRAGDRVRAGQRLLQLVDRRERLAAELAAAELERVRRLLARYADTEGTGAVPGSVIDEARSALRRAEIELAQAREAIAERVLRAPFAGVIGLPQVDPGDRVTPETVVATLDDRSRLELAFDLPEPYLARVQPGHPVQATSVAYAGRAFEGRVTQLDSRVAEDTRTLRVRAELPNDEDLLRPGQSFRVRLSLPGEAHLQLPEMALQWGREGAHVWVVRDGRAVSVPVRLMRRLEGAVLVDGALRSGEAVVVEGVQRLRPDRAVSVVEPAP